MKRFFLEVREGSYRIPRGKDFGYETLEEAKREAEKFVDDALPNNHVYILQALGYAGLAGDGGTYIRDLAPF